MKKPTIMETVEVLKNIIIISNEKMPQVLQSASQTPHAVCEYLGLFITA